MWLIAAASALVLAQTHQVNVTCGANTDCRRYGDSVAVCESGVCRCDRGTVTVVGQTNPSPVSTYDSDANICYPTFTNTGSGQLQTTIPQVSVVLSIEFPRANGTFIDTTALNTQLLQLLGIVVPGPTWEIVLPWAFPRAQYYLHSTLTPNQIRTLRSPQLNSRFGQALSQNRALLDQLVTNYNTLNGSANNFAFVSTTLNLNHQACVDLNSPPTTRATETALVASSTGNLICQSIICRSEYVRRRENDLVFCAETDDDLSTSQIVAIVAGCVIFVVLLLLVVLLLCCRNRGGNAEAPEEPAEADPENSAL